MVLQARRGETEEAGDHRGIHPAARLLPQTYKGKVEGVIARVLCMTLCCRLEYLLGAGGNYSHRKPPIVPIAVRLGGSAKSIVPQGDTNSEDQGVVRDAARDSGYACAVQEDGRVVGRV